MIHKPYHKFKGWLRENNLNYADLGALIGVSKTTISAKINGQSDFYLSEIQTIRKTYNLDGSIFFTDTVA